MTIKNLAGKSRKLTQGQPPYEIWDSNGWTFLVLKKNQADDNKPYAIWNVACVTPHETNLYGSDTYVADVKNSMRLVWRDPAYVKALADQGIPTPCESSPDGWKHYTS